MPALSGASSRRCAIYFSPTLESSPRGRADPRAGARTACRHAAEGREQRADRWREAWGVEQTEIDALATLRPDALAEILEDALAPFYDQTLARRVDQASREWQSSAQRIINAQFDRAQFDQRWQHVAGRLATIQSELDDLSQWVEEGVATTVLPEVVIPKATVDKATHGKALGVVSMALGGADAGVNRVEILQPRGAGMSGRAFCTDPFSGTRGSLPGGASTRGATGRVQPAGRRWGGGEKPSGTSSRRSRLDDGLVVDTGGLPWAITQAEAAIAGLLRPRGGVVPVRRELRRMMMSDQLGDALGDQEDLIGAIAAAHDWINCASAKASCTWPTQPHGSISRSGKTPSTIQRRSSAWNARIAAASGLAQTEDTRCCGVMPAPGNACASAGQGESADAGGRAFAVDRAGRLIADPDHQPRAPKHGPVAAGPSAGGARRSGGSACVGRAGPGNYR